MPKHQGVWVLENFVLQNSHKQQNAGVMDSSLPCGVGIGENLRRPCGVSVADLLQRCWHTIGGPGRECCIVGCSFGTADCVGGRLCQLLQPKPFRFVRFQPRIPSDSVANKHPHHAAQHRLSDKVPYQNRGGGRIVSLQNAVEEKTGIRVTLKASTSGTSSWASSFFRLRARYNCCSSASSDTP